MTPPLLHKEEENAFTTVIIGGGIAGASLLDALAALPNSGRVALVEKNLVSSGASGLAAGTLSVPGPVPRGSCDFASTLAIGSMQTYKQLEDEGFDVGLARCGSVTLAITDEQAGEVRREHAALRANGFVDNELIEDAARLAAVEPALADNPDFKVAMYQPWSVYVDPGAATRAFEERARMRGAHVIENDAVVGVCRDSETAGGRFCIRTASGRELIARNLVLATGAESNWSHWDGVPVALDIVRTKAHGVALAPRGLRRIVFCSDLYARHLVRTHTRADAPRSAFHVYGRPGFDDAANQVWFGMDRRPAADAGDFAVDGAQVREAFGFLARVAPRLFAAPRLSEDAITWTCQMPFSPASDGLPL